jgi:HEAT repeat protein
MNDEVIVNGVRVGPSTDLPALLRRQLIDGSVLAGRYDDTPEPGIWSLFAAAKGTALEQRLVEAVESLLTDPDPRVRSGAVGLAQAYAEKFRASDLLRILAGHRNLFEGITVKTGEPDLAWGLLRAMAGSSNWSPEVIERLRSAALEFPNGSSVLAGLVSHDPDWAIQHAQEVVGDQPARATILLYRLRDPKQRERLIRSIPTESPRLRKVMADAVSKEVKDPVEKERLLSLLR